MAALALIVYTEFR